MSSTTFLSMAKAVAYLGDAANAQQLLVTLQSTLETEIPKIQDAIASQNFEALQKILHQLKGFAPVFCQDDLVTQISHTEALCKHTDLDELKTSALDASSQLLVHLKSLRLEVKAQLQPTA